MLTILSSVSKMSFGSCFGTNVIDRNYVQMKSNEIKIQIKHYIDIWCNLLRNLGYISGGEVHQGIHSGVYGGGSSRTWWWGFHTWWAGGLRGPQGARPWLAVTSWRNHTCNTWSIDKYISMICIQKGFTWSCNDIEKWFEMNTKNAIKWFYI